MRASIRENQNQTNASNLYKGPILIRFSYGLSFLTLVFVWLTFGSWVPTTLSAWAVYPQTRYLSQRARLFIGFLIERFGDKPYWDND